MGDCAITSPWTRRGDTVRRFLLSQWPRGSRAALNATMREADLSIEAIRIIRKTRMRNTVGIFIGLIALWAIGDFAVNRKIELPFWITVLGAAVAPIGLIILQHYDESLSKYVNAHCPRCGEQIERSQFVGKKLPDYCLKCKLSIDAFNNANQIGRS